MSKQPILILLIITLSLTIISCDYSDDKTNYLDNKNMVHRDVVVSDGSEEKPGYKDWYRKYRDADIGVNSIDSENIAGNMDKFGKYTYKDLCPSWSSDGHSLLYMHLAQNPEEEEQGIYQIRIHDLLSHEDRFIINGMWPCWAPDGKSFVFRRGSLCIYNLENDSLEKIFTKADRGYFSHWGPDSLIVFESDYQNPRGAVVLWTINPYTRVYKNISEFGIGEIRMGYWFPDGERILYSHYVGGDRGFGMQLRIMNKDGTNINDLVYDTLSYPTPKISPNGEDIAFGRRIAGHERFPRLYMMNLEDRMPYLFAEVGVGNLDWSPDGEFLIYQDLTDGNLYIFDLFDKSKSHFKDFKFTYH
ncbi:MAG: hypothetical protein P9X24_10470 [Candidatus Hatepunaea meridiana]|nr:hypothetical protein [Candidatus Hatepunaea meridiana]